MPPHEEPVVHVAQGIRHEGLRLIVPPLPVHDELVLVVPAQQSSALSGRAGQCKVACAEQLVHSDEHEGLRLIMPPLTVRNELARGTGTQLTVSDIAAARLQLLRVLRCCTECCWLFCCTTATLCARSPPLSPA